MSRPQINGLTWATDENYSSGADNGLATKVPPSDAVRAQGVLPGTGAPAGRMNSILHDHGQILNYLRNIDWLNWIHMDEAKSLSTLDQGAFGAVAFLEDPDFSSPVVRFVAANAGTNHIYRSYDGLHWFASGTAGTFDGVDHARSLIWSEVAGLWILGSTAGSTDEILTSTTANIAAGGAWTARTDPQAAGQAHGGIAESDSIIIMPSTNILSSPDGINWTSRGNAASNGNLTAAAYSPELDMFVAVGPGGGIVSSPDGITWTDRTVAFGDLNDVCWDPVNGYFIAVGDGAGPVVWRSANGTSWSDVSLGGVYDDALSTVFSDGGCAVYAVGADYVIRSLDGGGSWDLQRIPGNIDHSSGVRGGWADSRPLLYGLAIAGTAPALAMGMKVAASTVLTP